jgi:hypothetical protein
MKSNERVEVKLHSFSNSTLNGSCVDSYTLLPLYTYRKKPW